MQTKIHSKFTSGSKFNSDEINEAEKILRSCVHCGFCNATCPTYLELGDERDGPRGRIYLLKQLLESGEASSKTQDHLDRCLTCRNCETTCPSGVQYGRLIDIGRGVAEEIITRPLHQRLIRRSLRAILPYPRRFNPLLRIAQWLRPLFPKSLKNKIPTHKQLGYKPSTLHARRMLVLAGCVQPVTTPVTNAAATRVFDRLGVSLIEAPKAACCGAVSYHLGAHAEGRDFMRRNIDAWWPEIEAGVEAIVITATGCGTMLEEYGHLLKDDPEYAAKAERVSALAKDISEILLKEDLSQLNLQADKVKTVVHCPCSMQHGLGIPDSMNQILGKLGFNLVQAVDDHLCCGSAGTYSILQPKMSKALLDKKLIALNTNDPERIVTANVGCQLHLASKANIPVRHWIELLDQ